MGKGKLYHFFRHLHGLNDPFENILVAINVDYPQ